MNVAYLDPPYSRYFTCLADALARRSGGQPLALLSSPAYRLYTGSDSTMTWPVGSIAQAGPLPEGSEHAVWSQVADVAFRGHFWHAVNWFKERLAAESVGLVLVFSDARPFSLAAAIAARTLGIPLVYFERGAFRFATASLSPLGLNARFSLDRARACVGVHGLASMTPIDKRATEPWLRTRFLRFMVHNALACALAPPRRRLQHKRYAVMPYVRLAAAQWWTEHRLARSTDEHLGLGASTPLVVVPLQLPSDSQLRLYSPFRSNQEFLDFVAECVTRVAPGARVLVKRHPMDAASYRRPPNIDWVSGNLARFFRQGTVLVCINSTVGFEAAVRGVPVVCFAPSFYTDEAPLVTQVSRGGFTACLRERLAAPPDPAAGRALREDILRWYQAPGDAWAFTRDDIERTADIVSQHVRMAGELSAAARASASAVAPSAPSVAPQVFVAGSASESVLGARAPVCRTLR